MPCRGLRHSTLDLQRIQTLLATRAGARLFGTCSKEAAQSSLARPSCGGVMGTKGKGGTKSRRSRPRRASRRSANPGRSRGQLRAGSLGGGLSLSNLPSSVLGSSGWPSNSSPPGCRALEVPGRPHGQRQIVGFGWNRSAGALRKRSSPSGQDGRCLIGASAAVQGSPPTRVRILQHFECCIGADTRGGRDAIRGQEHGRLARCRER